MCDALLQKYRTFLMKYGACQIKQKVFLSVVLIDRFCTVLQMLKGIQEPCPAEIMGLVVALNTLSV